MTESKTIWLTGLSGSGKTTIGIIIAKELSRPTYILDGDILRTGLNNNLGFSPDDRKENIRRAAEVCKILNNIGITVIACFISPYKEDRQMAKKIIGDNFLEVYISTPLEECEKRDVKGLYAKARSGVIKGFTGIDAPYEIPSNPDYEIDTYKCDAQVTAMCIIRDNNL